MTIYLVQHGKCISKELNPDRPLTEEGSTEVRKIAGVARGYKVKVSKIFHSGKTRTIETAGIIAEYLQPENGIDSLENINPNDDVAEFSQKDIIDDNSMFVGHQPFMGKLASYLITGHADIPVFKFQNGGIVCLEKNEDNKRWIIKWALMPGVN